MIAENENMNKLALDLEKRELESPAGTLTPQRYAQLLAIYLCQNDLCNAKYLWKRIPSNIKTSHAELPAIWKVGKNLWKRDFLNVYTTLNNNWSEDIEHIMKGVIEMIRKRAGDLISHAYTSISVPDLTGMVGMNAEDTLVACQKNNWSVDTTLNMVMPKKPVSSTDPGTSAEEQLRKLTDFVSFLEN